MSRAGEIEATAAGWLVRREAPEWSADDEAEFRAWLGESFGHRAAFWRLECGWRMADRIAALGPAACEPQAASERVGAERAESPIKRPLAIAASVAAALLFVPAAMRTVEPAPQPVRAIQVQTSLGGHKQISLADGSTVELSTATVLRAAISGKERNIWLDQGEAFFSVRRSNIPFIVDAGTRLISVVGTRFSVSREGSKVRVAVVDGAVRVSDADRSAPAPVATISGGDLLQADGESTLVLQGASARVERSLAWREGLLQFDQSPLIQVAQEFNRHNKRKLVIDGQSAAVMPVGGSFRASNVDGFARLLRDAYGLDVEFTPTEIKVSGQQRYG